MASWNQNARRQLKRIHAPLSVYLPGCSPELNLNEGVNGDLKQAVTGQEPARSKAQLKRATIGHMRKLSKLPDCMRSLFGHRTFRYAASLKSIQVRSIRMTRRASGIAGSRF
jgi:hypothetical protein